LPSKNPSQIKNRYKNLISNRNSDKNPIKIYHLSKKSNFNENEINLIKDGVKKFGFKWNLISKEFLPNRKPNLISKIWFDQIQNNLHKNQINFEYENIDSNNNNNSNNINQINQINNNQINFEYENIDSNDVSNNNNNNSNNNQKNQINFEYENIESNDVSNNNNNNSNNNQKNKFDFENLDSDDDEENYNLISWTKEEDTCLLKLFLSKDYNDNIFIYFYNNKIINKNPNFIKLRFDFISKKFKDDLLKKNNIKLKI
jgi:hypothetical protein